MMLCAFTTTTRPEPIIMLVFDETEEKAAQRLRDDDPIWRAGMKLLCANKIRHAEFPSRRLAVYGAFGPPEAQ